MILFGRLMNQKLPHMLRSQEYWDTKELLEICYKPIQAYKTWCKWMLFFFCNIITYGHDYLIRKCTLLSITFVGESWSLIFFWIWWTFYPWFYEELFIFLKDPYIWNRDVVSLQVLLFNCLVLYRRTNVSLHISSPFSGDKG